MSRRLASVAGLSATIDDARLAAERYDRLCHEVVAAGREAATYPISAFDLGRQAGRTARLVLQIRDVALAAAHVRVADSRQAALERVIVASIVLLLTVMAMIGMLILLQRRIITPVLALTEVISRIACLDFDVTVPACARPDEIGRMAVALDALRRGAMAGEANKAQTIHLARHDALTGLPNRLTLQERLDQAVAMAHRGQISAVLCLDLDRFKAVNDTFGHPTGDLLLRGVADRLLACIRESDTVSRLGGDEFVVLLIRLEQPDAAALVAQSIVTALNEPFDLDGQVVSVGCSVGIATLPRDGASGIALLKCADTALYRAKQETKGSWCFFQPEMDAHLRERTTLERELREAVRTEAFELLYQPQYRLSPYGPDGDRLAGFEALLRWRHPNRGLIGPGTFIAIAEETGLIVSIGAWVLRHACAEASHWPEGLMLSVNLSAVQFKQPDLVQMVRQAVDANGLPANRLELEITESVLLRNNPRSLGILRELHDLGTHIAMDDFGTGYSSLSYLRSFPFDKIKIDRAFISDLSERTASQAIVRAVVALANSLGTTTTAEGVETPEQLVELRRQGCTDVQGYLFGEPMTAADVRMLLERLGTGRPTGVNRRGALRGMPSLLSG